MRETYGLGVKPRETRVEGAVVHFVILSHIISASKHFTVVVRGNQLAAPTSQ